MTQPPALIHYCMSVHSPLGCPGYAFRADVVQHLASTCGTTAAARTHARTVEVPRTQYPSVECLNCVRLRAELEELKAAKAEPETPA